MQRRDVLQSIGAGGLLTLGVGTATAERPDGVAAADLDAVHIKRGDEMVATIQNPSSAKVERLHAELDSTEELVTPEKCCLKECREECAYCEEDCCDWIYEC